MNTSLRPGGVARLKDLRAGPPGARLAPPGPAGSSVPALGAPSGSLSVSSSSSGPAASTGDEWDDMDDFDLSGFEKFSRPAVPIPKGPRTPQGPAVCISKARGDAGPQEHRAEVRCSQGSSRGSVISLGDAGAAAVLSSSGVEEAHAGEVCAGVLEYLLFGQSWAHAMVEVGKDFSSPSPAQLVPTNRAVTQPACSFQGASSPDLSAGSLQGKKSRNPQPNSSVIDTKEI